MDSSSAIEKGFAEEFGRLTHERRELLDRELDVLSEEDALELGRQGAQAALAPLIWSAAIGDRWDVRTAAEFLKISRQALYKRLKTGSVLGVPGRGTTWFPAWQFDRDKRVVRHVVSSIIGAFHDADAELDPLVIASWATKTNRLLGDNSPAAWVNDNGDDGPVLLAARRAAIRLAS